MTTTHTTGFIGLGQMGAPMVQCLLKAGRRVVVYDINQTVIHKAVASGAIAATSVAELAMQSDAVITMLPSPAHVRAAFTGTDGIFAHARADAVLIDCSTTDPETSRQLFATAKAGGHPMADAPVSGAFLAAVAGTLTFLVGAEADLFQRVEPLLKDMGSNVIQCGGPGDGQVVKITNNLLSGITMVAAAEAMALGVKLGADPTLLANAINKSTGRCWVTEKYNPWPGVQADSPASNDYRGGAATSILIKDLSLALSAAKGVTHPLFLGAIAQQVYEMSANDGYADKDFTSVIELYRKTKAD